jgi:hypothetical protein
VIARSETQMAVVASQCSKELTNALPMVGFVRMSGRPLVNDGPQRRCGVRKSSVFRILPEAAQRTDACIGDNDLDASPLHAKSGDRRSRLFCVFMYIVD